MVLLFNNQDYTDAKNMVCLSDVPNIVKLTDEDYGTYATVTMVFDGTLSDETEYDGQWQLTIMGNTITNVMNAENAIGRTFYVSESSGGIAASVARALRNCPTLFSAFKVNNDLTSVYLKAREKGSIIGNNFITTNISDQYFEYTIVDGYSTNSALTDALIDVDIIGKDENYDDDYITTLEKTFVNGEVAFNISPVLSTMAEFGHARPFKLQVSKYKDGEYSIINEITDNFVSVGYMCNQGDKFVPLANGSITLAQNVLRGDSATGDETNKMPLYVCDPTIPISFYAKMVGGMTINIEYLDSAFNVKASGTTDWHNTNSSEPLKDYVVELDNRYFTGAYYVDVTLGSQYKLRYRVIHPLNASGNNYRVYWRNEYGGISWFDFTGDKSETRSLSNETYKKQLFDYYDSTVNELELIYNNDVDYEVTLTSHLFENDGKYIFNSLAQSPYVWTMVNNELYAILLTSVSCDEQEEGVYKATIKYKYSQPSTLL